MATRVRWLGHACLLFESDGKRVLVDPFLTGNPAAAAKADEVPADFILVSHGVAAGACRLAEQRAAGDAPPWRGNGRAARRHGGRDREAHAQCGKHRDD